MNYQCHIHPCQSAKERANATRIAEQVKRRHRGDREDLVEELLITLSAVGMEEARLARREDHTEVVIEGRVLLSWYPVQGTDAACPIEDADAPLSLARAAIAYHYSETTLSKYQWKGWLPKTLTHRALRDFRSTLVKGSTRSVRMRERVRAAYADRGHGPSTMRRKRSLLERWRQNRAKAQRKRSCMQAVPIAQRIEHRVVLGITACGPITLSLRPTNEYRLQSVTAALALRALHDPHFCTAPPVPAIAHSPP